MHLSSMAYAVVPVPSGLTVHVQMELVALPSGPAVQLEDAIYSVATVMVCVVGLPFFKVCFLGLRP